MHHPAQHPFRTVDLVSALVTLFVLAFLAGASSAIGAVP
jgi:hypothetical protein